MFVVCLWPIKLVLHHTVGHLLCHPSLRVYSYTHKNQLINDNYINVCIFYFYYREICPRRGI